MRTQKHESIGCLSQDGTVPSTVGIQKGLFGCLPVLLKGANEEEVGAA